MTTMGDTMSETGEARRAWNYRQRQVFMGQNQRDLDLADAALAEADAALVRVQQCHVYRLPIVAEDKETGEAGVHFIDGYDAAEVLEAIRHAEPFPPYESVDWTTDLQDKLAAARAALADFMSRHTAAGCGMDAATGSLHIMTTGVMPERKDSRDD